MNTNIGGYGTGGGEEHSCVAINLYYSIAHIAQQFLLFQHSRINCNDFQRGCVGFFLLGGKKKNKQKICIFIVYLEHEAVPSNISHFKCMLLTIDL